MHAADSRSDFLDWISDGAWFEVDFSKGEPYATFDWIIDLFGDRSVVPIKGGGHTPDDLGALLALPNGPVLLAADLAVHWTTISQESPGLRAYSKLTHGNESLSLLP